jgi:SAM-dependent methyltransferase
MTRWTEIARATAGEDYARQYAARFRAMAAEGKDTHGEASFVAGLVAPPASVLDAGCGTGRVAIRLVELGYEVVGVDVDAAMLAMARQEAPDLDWREGDLSTFDLGARFDVVLMAGNTIPLLEAGTLLATAQRLAAHLTPTGLLVCGFGLDPAHLPPGCPPTSMVEVEVAFEAAGLVEVDRFSTWDGAPWSPQDGYVVAVHTT